MTEPCAVFWDIQNVGVPRGQTVDSIANQVRSTIIKPHNLNEIFFFCVCDVHLPSNVDHSLNLDFQACNGVSADIKIMELMRKFVKLAGKDCTIILLSGDGDYYGTLSDLKKLHNVSIHLIGLVDSFSSKLVQIADYTFMLANGLLKPVKSTGNPTYFIAIQNYPLSLDINQVMNELNAKAIGSIGNSAIRHDSLICIAFPTLLNAEKAIEQLNASLFHGHFLKVELLSDSPLTEILKYVKPNMTMETKSNNEVKQLTFIEMRKSNEAVDNKIIEFCIACSAQSGSRCILSRKPFLWIIFAFNSDAQKFLAKVKIIYPDAIISEPLIDLTSKCLENSYFVESCEEKDTNNGASSAVSLNVRDDTDWNIFFRYNPDFTAPMPYYEPTKWSLLYNLFEQLYDLGAKKVIFDGNVYCAHFDSASAYRDALGKIPSRYLKPLESVYVPETDKQKAAMKMNRYMHEIPWCLNEQLDLYCLVIKIKSQLHDHFIEISKSILGNRECIFIKSTPGEIWVGFPNELICENSKQRVDGFIRSVTYRSIHTSEVIPHIAKPSNELLESINFRDLAGDAYDLAFLSSQLEDAKPITRPRIIERIKMQRMQEQECNETVFHLNVFGKFYKHDRPELKPGQLVKVLVKFSKVIPLAAVVFHSKVILIYSSLHEEQAARHFIEKLTTFEAPYFMELSGPGFGDVKYSVIGSYYIINDKRKVLEKILQNTSLVGELDSNSSVQLTADIDVLDEEMTKKLQYIFVITTDSDFKFTSGMISIIKLNLEDMDCPVCIEFEDKVWVAVDDLEKGKKAKAKIDQICFKLLHENDEDDFKVRVVMDSIQESPPKVTKMLKNKLLNPNKGASNILSNPDPFPLGHFNYSYSKAVGMSASRYWRLYCY